MHKNKNKKITLGLLIPELFDFYQMEILDGIHERVSTYGVKLYCFFGGAINYTAYPHVQRNPIYDLISRDNIDVLLLMTGSLSVAVGNEGIIKFLDKYPGIPAISLGIKLPGITSIVVDNETGMYEVVSHLINKHDCKDIAFIKGPEQNEEAIIRFNAYKKCLQDHNIAYNDRLICPGAFELGDGEKAVKLLVDKRKVSFDALIGVDDYTIINAIKPLMKRGFEIPEDVKIAGFDDVKVSQYSTPPLTTVRQPLYDLGAMAVDTAMKMLNNEHVPDVIDIDTHAVFRNSCGCTINNVINVSFDRGDCKDYHVITKEFLNERKLELKNTLSSFLYHEEKTYIEKQIDYIVNLIFITIENRDMLTFQQNIEVIFLDSYKKGYYASYWETILSNIIQKFKLDCFSPDDAFFITNLLNLIFIVFYKTETRLRAFSESESREFSQNLQRLGDKIITCFNSQQIKSVLKVFLDDINIENCLIALYEDSMEKAYIFFLTSNPVLEKKVHTVFDPHDLYPQELAGFNDKNFVIIPILSEYMQLGYMVIELTDTDKLLYEYLSERVSSAITGMEMMEKIRNHTIELENEVEKRTEDLKRANQLLKEKSYRDQLSGLYNRRFLMDIILPGINSFITDLQIESIKQNKRSKNKNNSLALISVDIDYFKSVNDTYGHVSGDMLLKQVSEVFIRCLRKDDYIVRMGGEEFLLILKDFNPEFLAVKANKVREAIEQYPFLVENDQIIKRTCSIGCLTYPLHPDFPDIVDFLSAINLADKALYHAKNTGRNKAIVVSLNDNCIVIDEKMSIENIRFVFNSFDQAYEKEYIELLDASEIIG